jgi:predicted methyltransferase
LAICTSLAKGALPACCEDACLFTVSAHLPIADTSSASPDSPAQNRTPNSARDRPLESFRPDLQQASNLPHGRGPRNRSPELANARIVCPVVRNFLYDAPMERDTPFTSLNLRNLERRSGIGIGSKIAAIWLTAAGICLSCSANLQSTESPASAPIKEDPARDAWAQPERVVQALSITNPAATIADIGAGNGYFSRRLAKAVPEGKVLAVEVDGNLRRHIESQRATWGTPNIEARLAVYEHPLLPEASVDGVFISNTYSYLQDRVAYLRKVATALRPGGFLAIVDFREDAQCKGIASCPEKGARVAGDTVKSEAASAGFHLLREESFLPHQYLLIFELAAGQAADQPSEPSAAQP